MKLIIAGGRDYKLTGDDYINLLFLSNDYRVSEVVSGGARGADRGGEEWANLMRIPIKVFKADWKKHGKAAGPIRNKEMAEYADMVALFPGGRGTESMCIEAKKAGLIIFDYRGVRYE